jgi:hypothetical protein
VVRRPPIGGDPVAAGSATDWNVDDDAADDAATETMTGAAEDVGASASEAAPGADWSVDDD